MVVKSITYFIDGKKKKINAKVLKNVFAQGTGLMFKKNSPPLLFPFKKEMYVPITSLFCKPFTAIWLDKDMKAKKITVVKKWKFHIPGRGMYLLEIPFQKKKISTLENKEILVE